MRTLLDHLRAQCERLGDPVVCHLIADGIETVIRQRDLMAHAAAYAQQYRARSVRQRQPVLIILRHSPDLLYAFLGALLAGTVPVFLAPISEKQTPGRYWTSLQRLLTAVDAGALVIDPIGRAELESHIDMVGLPVVTPEECGETLEMSAWPNPAPEDIAFLQFSSGTTGLRKCVALSHDRVVAQIEAYRVALGLETGDLIASWLPLYHDMGLVACMIVPLAFGIPVVMLDPFEWVYRPSLLLQVIERYRATHVWLPNFAFNHLSSSIGQAECYDLRSMKAFIDCSEPCKAASLRRFVERFAAMGVTAAQIQVCYAMAEAVFAVTQTAPGQPIGVLSVDPAILAATGRAVETCAAGAAELLSAGRPIAGMDVRIIGDNGGVQPDREIGEIAIRGRCVFPGYYQADADAGRADFAGDWYRTGDLGFTHDGELYVTGRKMDLIISYGNNYYAHDIEAIVGEVVGVKPGRAVAFGLHNEISGSEDVIVIAESALRDESQQKLLARNVKSAVLGALNLTVGKVVIATPQWLAKTTSGKISRSDNRARYLQLAAETLKTAG